jgi:hypothetical protein
VVAGVAPAEGYYGVCLVADDFGAERLRVEVESDFPDGAGLERIRLLAVTESGFPGIACAMLLVAAGPAAGAIEAWGGSCGPLAGGIGILCWSIFGRRTSTER